MEEFVARENIRRFQALLDACADPLQRKTLEHLLQVERQRLTEAQNRKRRHAG
jgi:hypothetical protein